MGAALVGRFGPAAVVLAVQLVWFPVPLGIAVRGLLVGLLTALLAVGMALVHRSHRVLNFAGADLGLPAAVVALMVVTFSGWPWAAGLVVGLVAAALTGAATERVVVRRFDQSPRLLLTVGTIGLAQILAAAAVLIPRLWGERLLAPRIPAPFSASIEIGGVVLGGADVIAMVLAPAALVGLAAFLRFSDAGLTLRASADGPMRAALLGVRVPAWRTAVWSLAAALAFLALFLRAGVLGLPVGTAMSLAVLLRALTALALGRLSDLPAIAAAAVALGLLEAGIGWNASSPLLVDPILGLVIAGALLLRWTRRRGDRTLEAPGEWRAVDDLAPLPAPLARRAPVRTGRFLAAVAGGVVVLVLPHLLASDDALKASAVAVYATLALSFVVLTGWTGLVSLGQAGFFAVGAAVAAALMGDAGLDPLGALGLAGVAGAAVAVVVGLPTIRLRGVYLAVTTFAFALAATSYLLSPRFFDWVPTGRFDRPELLGSIRLTSTTAIYYFSVAVFVAVALAMRSLRRSRTGRALVALREGEAVAATFGISPWTGRITAFAISGAVAGLAGAVFALHQQAFGSQPFQPAENLALLVMAVLGGVTSVTGALLGALAVRATGWFLPAEWQGLTTGAGVLVVLLLIPSGIAGALARLRDALLGVRVSGGVDRAAASPGQGGPAPRSRAEGAVLSVRGLRVRYGTSPILHGVDLDVRPGEVVAVLGTNGAGKSTLLRAVSGILDITSGSVMLDGTSVAGWSPHRIARAGVAHVPGGDDVFAELTVGENLRVASRVGGRGALVSGSPFAPFPVLSARRAARAGDLSGGQRRMLSIAMALQARPRVLLIDELTHGLAPGAVSELLDEVDGLRARGIGIVLVEQSPELARRVADRVVVLDQGSVVWEGSVEDLGAPPTAMRSVFLDRAPVRGAEAGAPAVTGLRAAAALTATGVGRAFGGLRAVVDVSLEVERGEILAVVGPNGAGKSTLLDVLSGHLRPDRGRVLLGRADVTRAPPHWRARHGLGRTFQDSLCLPGLTVKETLAVASTRHVPSGGPLAAALRLPSVFDAEEWVDAGTRRLLARFGLEPVAEVRARDLSTGMRRVVDLAGIVALAPTVALLDEPSSGLAAAEVGRLGPLLTGLAEEGMGVVLVEHHLDLVHAVADRVMVMVEGSILAEGPPDAVFTDPDVAAAMGIDVRPVPLPKG